MPNKNDGYLGNDKLKKIGVDLSYTKEQVKEIIKCTEDPVHFIRTYVQIISVDKGLVPFDMWPFQENMVTEFHKNRFSICQSCFKVLTCSRKNCSAIGCYCEGSSILLIFQTFNHNKKKIRYT